jgi:hypothetical protein
MVHETVHQLVQPIFLVCFKGDKVVLVIYESLVIVTDSMLGIHEVKKVPVDSFRGAREFPEFSFSQNEFVYAGQNQYSC